MSRQDGRLRHVTDSAFSSAPGCVTLCCHGGERLVTAEAVHAQNGDRYGLWERIGWPVLSIRSPSLGDEYSEEQGSAGGAPGAQHRSAANPLGDVSRSPGWILRLYAAHRNPWER